MQSVSVTIIYFGHINSNKLSIVYNLNKKIIVLYYPSFFTFWVVASKGLCRLFMEANEDTK